MASGDITDAAISASTYYSSNVISHKPQLARLHWTILGTYQGWVAKTLNANQWLQIDLGKMQFISGVATQGRHKDSQWVKHYWLQHSNDGVTWNNYQSKKVGRLQLSQFLFVLFLTGARGRGCLLF